MKAATVGVDGYLKGEALSSEDRASEHYQLYYERDLKLMTAKNPPPLLLEPLCSMYDFDLVLIDGNEYTGFAEYEIVERVCQPRFLALHDTGTLKTRKVEAALNSPHSIWQKVNSGQGWAVYERHD